MLRCHPASLTGLTRADSPVCQRVQYRFVDGNNASTKVTIGKIRPER